MSYNSNDSEQMHSVCGFITKPNLPEITVLLLHCAIEFSD